MIFPVYLALSYALSLSVLDAPVTLEKTFHHEGHEEHEGKTADMAGYAYKKLHLLGVCEFLDNTLKLFVNFVIFVVRLPNLR